MSWFKNNKKEKNYNKISINKIFDKIQNMEEKKKIYLFSVWIIILIILYILQSILFKDNNKQDTQKNNNYIYSYLLDENEEDDDNSTDKIEVNNTVEIFSEYCFNQEFEKAYEIIETGTKNEKFPDIESFKKYIKEYFNENTIYNLKDENIFQLKYAIEVYDNVISTGKWEKKELKKIKIQIVMEDGINKIKIID